MDGLARIVTAAAVSLAVAACSGAGTGPAATSTPSVTPIPTPLATATATAIPATPTPATTTGTSAASIYDPAADPSADIAAALAVAAGDGKPVLLDFGADWCPDCVVLARMFESAAFADYLAGVHVVRIDVGYWDDNLDVSKQYGDPIAAGIPAVVLLSPAGDVLGTTADGRLASAASMTPDQVLAVLRSLGG